MCAMEHADASPPAHKTWPSQRKCLSIPIGRGGVNAAKRSGAFCFGMTVVHAAYAGLQELNTSSCFAIQGCAMIQASVPGLHVAYENYLSNEVSLWDSAINL
jgi:hypothetical protein